LKILTGEASPCCCKQSLSQKFYQLRVACQKSHCALLHRFIFEQGERGRREYVVHDLEARVWNLNRLSAVKILAAQELRIYVFGS
jgi:hypothetical protein